MFVCSVAAKRDSWGLVSFLFGFFYTFALSTSRFSLDFRMYFCCTQLCCSGASLRYASGGIFGSNTQSSVTRVGGLIGVCDREFKLAVVRSHRTQLCCMRTWVTLYANICTSLPIVVVIIIVVDAAAVAIAYRDMASCTFTKFNIPRILYG